ncbi:MULTISPECIES: bifunctional 2',3'-cyclic-nucleotide 2'-phosphodiesterase/3'-nucleotidase [Bacillus cereus group]|uniref:bifunctional 2',3'-cyclic-nucleotide 2'-phosphodiesterase/3'-nucleotidase n=1 Tax=Bacillus cereus group TaxID=86661 RepID=UPI000BEBB606|nr:MULTISPECIES: bifunctional 2',3'-cyclic-nucleotide 2'-phosphodiesterase/3'-nucleotidase [Bacillus cereus group]MEB9861169.1 bifunctional 2',3'-cyclic-nucleotide 2'-phosphodiesterase/3'-nucleotidase [Bacillus cereus]MEB9875583.1 bifunctional 2',3'-cyclic-nucleotide 2'-phosphodiesterase/3'-nucleotidase [Bacillus cereus]PDY19334.1 bifunctional 2',3'-cyclic-nucleotide 2'-phosphodiesterase/3'-nucleotidase [Bacillus cereus]PET63372.1 bifunctional 2',3'-cyclic-nucleotide 2'-phosphodiesterase/3'-nuc
MKKSKKMLAGATLAIGVIAPQVLPATAHADEQTGESTVNLRILETSDIHVNLMNYDYYQTKTDNKVGLVQTATLVNKAREEAKNSVLFDDGDALQGTPLGDYVANKIKDPKNPVDPSYTHPLYRVMNLMKYDVISLGNHEFNYGLDYLKKVTSKTKIPVINSNVYRDDHDGNDENDEHYFDRPYHILEKEVVDEAGQKQIVKIGVMGFVPPQIMNWDKANLEGQVKAKDIVETAKKMVPKMKAEGADVIVALAHSGVDKSGYNVGMENASYYLTEVPGVNAVLMGHSHTEVKDVFNGVPVVMPGVFGSNLGIIDMQLKKVNGKWEVQKDQSKPQLRPIANSKGTPLVESDQKLVNEIKDEHEKTIEYVNTHVGETKAPINSYFSLVQDDPSVQIVTNAQKWYVEQELKKPEYEKIKDIPVLSAGAPFKAGGRNGATYYTDIPAGTLAIKNVADLYVYPNTLYAVKVNGAQVKEWLEMSAGQFNQIDPKKTEEQPLVNIGYPTYNFDILDGLKYEIDVTQPAKYDKDGKVVNANANRIVNMTYEGKLVADKQEFIVATNNYRGSSQTFPGVSKGEVVYQSQDETRQIIVKYMQKIKDIDPAADQNWTFKPIVADKLNTTFDSSPNAQKYIKKDGKISYVGPSENEFAKYAIDITKKNDDKETGEGNPTTPPTGGGENPTTPPTGNGENPTPPTEEGNNGNEPKQDGNNTGSGQTTTDDQNTKETTTTVSENKEAEKDERDLPKTGASIASTIGAGLAFVGAGLLMLFRRKKANR